MRRTGVGNREHDFVVGVSRGRCEVSMLRGAWSTVLIRAGGVGVSRSLRMRKVSGSIPDQSSYVLLHASSAQASSVAAWLFCVVCGAHGCGICHLDDVRFVFVSRW